MHTWMSHITNSIREWVTNSIHEWVTTSIYESVTNFPWAGHQLEVCAHTWVSQVTHSICESITNCAYMNESRTAYMIQSRTSHPQGISWRNCVCTHEWFKSIYERITIFIYDWDTKYICESVTNFTWAGHRLPGFATQTGMKEHIDNGAMSRWADPAWQSVYHSIM